MTSFTFRCPTSGLLLQGWAEAPKVAEDYFEAVECTACKRAHLVNPRTGKVIEGPPLSVRTS